MEAFAEYVEATDSRANITYIDLTRLDNEKLKDYHALNEFIEGRYDRKKTNYIFIDEVQLCPNFELISFQEYMKYYLMADSYAAFDQYIVEGGMASSYASVHT